MSVLVCGRFVSLNIQSVVTFHKIAAILSVARCHSTPAILTILCTQCLVRLMPFGPSVLLSIKALVKHTHRQARGIY